MNEPTGFSNGEFIPEEFQNINENIKKESRCMN
jgi:hypothetical protein